MVVSLLSFISFGLAFIICHNYRWSSIWMGIVVQMSRFSWKNKIYTTKPSFRKFNSHSFNKSRATCTQMCRHSVSDTEWQGGKAVSFYNQLVKIAITESYICYEREGRQYTNNTMNLYPVYYIMTYTAVMKWSEQTLAYFDGDFFRLIFAIQPSLRLVYKSFVCSPWWFVTAGIEKNDVLAPAPSDRFVHPFTKQVCCLVTDYY